MQRQLLFSLLLLSACTCYANSEVSDSIGIKMIKGVADKYCHLSKKISSNSLRYLTSLQKKDDRLTAKIAQKDSVLGARMRVESVARYRQLKSQVSLNEELPVIKLDQYNPLTDSLQTALGLLDKISLQPGKEIKVKAALDQIRKVRSLINTSADIKKFINDRKQLLKEQLNNIGLVKELKGFNKEAYYYQAQIAEYKALLNDPGKMEEKILRIIRNNAVFKDFMVRNSMLSQLFPVPVGYGSPQALQGLQTRSVVQQQLSSQLNLVSGGQQYLQQQGQVAQSQLNEIKNKVNKFGGGGGDVDMPDFTPNTQKTKSFLKRIEYGVNIQSQKTNAMLPVTSDIALTIGYKLNDKSVFGFGAGYKIGWGKNISNIKISSQGVSLRSYGDIKMKGSIWITGGYEYNYQQEFEMLEQLKDLSAWQKSGLLGITKKYKVGKKNGNMQLLWDFLSYSQVPRTPALKFRIGYQL